MNHKKTKVKALEFGEKLGVFGGGLELGAFKVLYVFFGGRLGLTFRFYMLRDITTYL